MILSACWYLDHIEYGTDWSKYYNCYPREFDGTPQEKARILGGIAALWSEFVDATNVEARLWPRASAVAERLWSSASATGNAFVAWPRLHEHRCRMISRGFRAQPVQGSGDWCPEEWIDSV